MRSDRPRTLRELNPSLLIGARRRRTRDAAARASAALSRFLGGLLRRQGQDWRALCDELRAKEAAARREADDLARELRTKDRALRIADEKARIAEAGMRHADGERDDAQRALCAQGEAIGRLIDEHNAKMEKYIYSVRGWLAADENDSTEEAIRKLQKRAAAWEIEAQDLRDKLTEGSRLLDSERAAWREERAGLVRERHALANRCTVAEGRVARLVRAVRALAAQTRKIEGKPDRAEVRVDLFKALLDATLPPADPDPRQGRPGGADLLGDVARERDEAQKRADFCNASAVDLDKERRALLAERREALAVALRAAEELDAIPDDSTSLLSVLEAVESAAHGAADEIAALSEGPAAGADSTRCYAVHPGQAFCGRRKPEALTTDAAAVTCTACIEAGPLPTTEAERAQWEPAAVPPPPPAPRVPGGADLSPCAHVWTGHGYCAHCGADRAKYVVPPPPPAAPEVTPADRMQQWARVIEGIKRSEDLLAEPAAAPLAATHEPPAGASPLDVVNRAPNMRMHRWLSMSPDSPWTCSDCGARPSLAINKPCPGPRAAEPIAVDGPAAFAASSTVAEGDDE